MYLFSIIMNFIAAVALFGAGSLKMNNLGTSIPGTLCVIAGICGAIKLHWDTKYPDDVDDTADKDEKG